MLTTEPVNFQEMLPGGLLGARRYTLVKSFTKATESELQVSSLRFAGSFQPFFPSVT